MEPFSSLQPDEVGEREIFDSSLQRKQQSCIQLASHQKIHPVEKDFDKNSSKSSTSPETAAISRVRLILIGTAFGMVVCVCLGWTLWLILLNVAPNDTVNRVMNTESFDYGSFWLMVDPSKKMVGFATFGLSLVAVGYIGILLKLITHKRSIKRPHVVRQSNSKSLMSKIEKTLQETTDQRTGSRVASAAILISASMRNDSLARKRVKLMMKFGDLVLETLLLYQMLEAGSPMPLIVIFTLVAAMNALVCAAMMFVPHEHAPLAETLIDILFDFLIIVGCPMLVILYCLSSFTFDRAKFAINMEVFPSGWFEQGASVIADAKETGVIYESLKSLRIMTPLSFFSHIGVNMTLCVRLWKLVDHLFDTSLSQKSSVYPKRHHFGAASLVVFAIMLIVFVEESMRTSSLACQPHPECVVNARRWTFLKTDSLKQCPCLMLIDRDLAPKTYAIWEHPINLTDKVAQLAFTGDMHTLQLTNRYLAVLPDELRRCKSLRHLSLEYTHTQTFPPWVKEFTKLEYLHVESKFTSPMVILPNDMFDGMSSLTTVHFAGFVPMVKLPSFNGLTNLKSVTLAVFPFLNDLPSFESLHNLERIVLSCLLTIVGLPDFSPINNLKSFSSMDRAVWCCNGFLGDCDLNNPNCGVHPVWGSPAATCLNTSRSEDVATPATLAAAQKFRATTCGPVLQIGGIEGPPMPEIMAPCNGTMYRQCGNAQVMCYNARYMAIACTPNPYPIEMRRRQIARGVGDPCDPEIEAWLGCKK